MPENKVDQMITGKRIRTVREIIDQAIAENRAGERLQYGFAVVFLLGGISVIIWAAIKEANVFAFVGFLTTALFWPAMSSVRRIRKESVAIRLLEAPLSRADTAREAAEMLHHLFQETFRDRQQDGAQASKEQARIITSESERRRAAEL